MSLLGTLQSGQRGLAVASSGIDVTAANVTGASQPGFSRRRSVSSQLAPIQQHGLWLGQGANPSAVLRSTDRLLGVRLIDATGAKASADTLAQNLRVVETYFDATNTTGLAESLDKVFDALGAATADPSDASLRRGAVHACEVFATTTSRIASGLADTRESLDQQLSTSLDEVNTSLAEIAALNERIGKSGAEAGPADLLDRRDQVILDLAGKVGATAELKADGQAVVYIGGHEIVAGGDWRALSVGTDAAGDTTLNVAMDNGSFNVTDVAGGKVGGLVQARAATSDWIDTLDQFAFTMANTFNTQHTAGFDKSGNPGGDLFSVTASATGAATGLSVTGAIRDDPTLLAFAGAATALPGDGDNLQSLLDIEDDTTLFAAGTNPRATISDLTADVGSQVASAAGDVEAQTALVDDLTVLRDSVSGVDTDEEATHLLEYQSAYRAAAKVISAADELLRTLLQIAG